jgi:hypothetical protein
MSVFVAFLLSILSGIGLFWILKYKTKFKLFKFNSFYIKSMLTVILANIGFISFCILQGFFWMTIVKHSPSYEINDGSMGGAMVDKAVADNYNTTSFIIFIVGISMYVLVFLKGLIYRNNQSPITSNLIENKSLFKLKIGLTLLFFITMAISLIMFVISMDFTVSYLD